MKDIPYLSPKTHQTKFEINLRALRQNLKFYRSLLAENTELIVMVKAFAYGLGLSKISEVLDQEQVDYLAVAYTDEAVRLREAGYKGKLMVFNPEPHCFDNLVQHKLEPEIYSLKLLQQYQKVIKRNAAYQLINPPVHLKIDTGMHRLGMQPEEVPTAIRSIKRNGVLKVHSIFTHLAAADEAQHDDFTDLQVKRFVKAAKKAEEMLGYSVKKHVANSAAMERFPHYQFDMTRLGIGLYGYSPQPEIQKKLKTVCSLRSKIAQIRTVKKGETIGYGRAGKVKRDSRIAIVFLGYADGLPRSLSNTGKLYLKGHMAPIIGNVCMDITMLDVTGIPCRVGDYVEVFGPNFPVEKFAGMIGTIPYEVFTDISSRVRRIYRE